MRKVANKAGVLLIRLASASYTTTRSHSCVPVCQYSVFNFGFGSISNIMLTAVTAVYSPSAVKLIPERLVEVCAKYHAP